MAFCELAHDLLDPCRKAQMPCNLPCKTADPSGARQLRLQGLESHQIRRRRS